MHETPEAFSHRMSRSSSGSSTHISGELLKEIDTNIFSKRLLTLHPSKQRLVLGAISSRLAFVGYSPQQNDEKEWLRKLSLNLEDYAKSPALCLKKTDTLKYRKVP